jgi:hypothetical protein
MYTLYRVIQERYLSTHQRPTAYSSYYSLILVSLYWAVLAVCYWLKKGSQLGGMARWEESIYFFFFKWGDLCPAWWSCVLECMRTLRYMERTLEVNLFFIRWEDDERQSLYINTSVKSVSFLLFPIGSLLISLGNKWKSFRGNLHKTWLTQLISFLIFTFKEFYAIYF